MQGQAWAIIYLQWKELEYINQIVDLRKLDSYTVKPELINYQWNFYNLFVHIVHD